MEWLEAPSIAQAVGSSLMLTAWLSAVHAIGFTLTMSGAARLAAAITLILEPEHRCGRSGSSAL